MNLKLITATALTIAAGIVFGGFLISSNRTEALSEERVQVILRDIGHRLLLHSGDSTSRVLPVRRLSEGVYRVEFESEFAFRPDTLVGIVDRAMTSVHFSKGYIVNVFECGVNRQIVYSFAKGPADEEIVPCLGRTQPLACYAIQVTFTGQESGTVPALAWFAGICIALIGLVTSIVLSNSRKTTEGGKNTAMVALGQYCFQPQTLKLYRSDVEIELTDKESRLMSVLVMSLNEVVPRNQLMKEVWEDDGVIVGRSLDVFVSRLRKKLMEDQSVKITNIHGKGYRLEAY